MQSLGVRMFAPRLMSGQISNELVEYYHVQGLEDVRVIRDRQTSTYMLVHIYDRTNLSTEISRQIGFLRFYSLNDSIAFIEQNAPTLYLYGRNTGNDERGAKVRISYTRERDDRRGKPEGEWTCRNVSLYFHCTVHC